MKKLLLFNYIRTKSKKLSSINAMKSILYLLILVLLLSPSKIYAQSIYDLINEGKVNLAMDKVNKLVESDEKYYLKGKLFRLMGKYDEAINSYRKLKEDDFKDLANEELIDIYTHHKIDLGKAKSIISENKYEGFYLANVLTSPLSVQSKGRFEIPFDINNKYHPYLPSITGSINGVQTSLYFDTGANYLVMPVSFASTFNISYDSTHSNLGQQGYSTSRIFYSTVDSLYLTKNLLLVNVPVILLEEMNTELVVFGTNIIKQFKTTIDYPNNKFILTNDLKLIQNKSMNEISGKFEMPFFLAGDHYMFGQGTLNNKEVNMFFDTGLVVVGQVDDKIEQSWFAVTDSEIQNFKPDYELLSKSVTDLITSNITLKFANHVNNNAIFSTSGEREFIFEDIKCDLLISHGILSKYKWTIDFERMVYLFE